MKSLNKDICDILECAVNDRLENFTVKVHDGNNKGEGLLGELFFISLKNKTTNDDVHLVIKQVNRSDSEDALDMMSSCYFNEIHFYTQIIPSLQTFQKSYPGVNLINSVPKCLATSSVSGFEKIALENLKFKNFEIHPKSVPLDPKAFEMIFKVYGELHGLSYAYQHYHPKAFLELTKPLHKIWVKICPTKMFSRFVKFNLRKAKQYFEDEKEEKIVNKLEEYLENYIEIIKNCNNYKGTYPALLHGDCWSNNLMFKYDVSNEIEDVKIFDFQIAHTGSPVLDLSYSFYAGASKKSLDNFEKLLKTYYQSLSDTLTLYRCDPETIYSYKMLKNEWKEYCQAGIILGLVLWGNKCTEDFSNMPTMNEMMNENGDDDGDLGIKINEENHRKYVMDIIRHVHCHNFL